MTVPKLGDILRSIHGGLFDDELKYIVQQAYLRRGVLTGEYLLTDSPDVNPDGLVDVPGETTVMKYVHTDGIARQEVYPGSLSGVTSKDILDPVSVRSERNTGGAPYFTYRDRRYLKSLLLGKVFLMDDDYGTFDKCLVKIEKINKVNFLGRVLTEPTRVVSGTRERRLVDGARDGTLMRFDIEALSSVLAL